MNDGVVVAFSLPTPTDEGMCPDFLAQALVNTHNDFVQRVDQALLMRNQEVQRHASRTTEIASTFMTPAHALEFELEEEFVPYVAKHCLAYDDEGEAAFDFVSLMCNLPPHRHCADNNLPVRQGVAEKFLVERYLRNKPLLNLRLRGFNYADEHTQERAELSSKVSQQLLPHGFADRIREQLVGAAAAQHALSQVRRPRSQQSVGPQPALTSRVCRWRRCPIS